MPEKRDNSVHIRLSDEADAVAELLKEVNGVTKVDLLTKLIHKALLGEGHDVKVAAMRFARLGLTGINRELGP